MITISTATIGRNCRTDPPTKLKIVKILLQNEPIVIWLKDFVRIKNFPTLEKCTEYTPTDHIFKIDKFCSK